MKKCTGCNLDKPYTEFHKNKGFKDGLNYRCKSCFKKYYNKNKETIIKQSAISQEKNKEYRKKYLKKYNKSWRENNPDKNTYKSNMYRSRKLNRTPQWADKSAIKEFYKNCPKGYHVDHIIPLKGKNVSGLHLITNLQYLPAIENVKKSNKF